MLWYVYVILSVALYNYNTPNPADSALNTATAAVLTWFRIELYAWFGIVFSNMVFMFLRSLKKPALDPTVYIDENKKVPSIDTLIALHEVASLFHTEFVPFFMGNC
jgi:hypothetical protein